MLLHTTPASAAATLVKLVVEASAAAIKQHGFFTLVLSGGSLPTSLSAIATVKGIEWDKVFVFYVDERNVPHSHADSNHKLALESFLNKVGGHARVGTVCVHLGRICMRPCLCNNICAPTGGCGAEGMPASAD